MHAQRHCALHAVLVLNLGSDYGLRRAVITAPRLKDALVKARADYLSWNGHTGILGWILTVSAIALDGEAEQDWFILQHQILLGYAGIKSEAEFHRVLEESLHVHNVQHTPLKKIIDKLEATKQWSVD
jgi:hypothetical protein